MSLAALELNDQSLLIQGQDGALHAEPGFARLTETGVVTGEEARALAWRQPQFGYNQYWRHLNQTPLVAKRKWARHHGDIAFAQLRSLWTQVGKPQRLLLLAPGSFSDTQLSLVLGMAAALPVEVAAVVDSGLAACLEARRRTLYVDMHLHQVVLTVCAPQAGRVSIEDQEVFPELGLMQLQNSAAHQISKLLIDSARYDPLHASDSEQRIHDQLPAWLTQLCWKPEISATVDTEHGALPFILRQDTVRSLLAERMASIDSFCARHPGCELVLAQGAALLAGLSHGFAAAAVAPSATATALALAHADALLDQGQGLHRVRDVQRGVLPSDEPALNGRLATHVLHGDHALPLNTPLSIRVTEGGLHLANAIDETADLTLVLRQRQLETLRQSPGANARLPAECVPGEAIEVGGHRLRLIEVRHG